ncbi:hypothetical protein SAY86_029674 [Trapa natans]|uniref:GRAM domain-containing protein n=1 Tax=Trapa natans TaxID=22666 RepID=A0AAN7MN26_TRANT|nr:hypothetical protein SAY86_029674 [Trapa natans]
MEQIRSDQPHAPNPPQEPDTQHQAPHSADYSPYPKIDPADVAPPPENWSHLTSSSPRGPISGDAASTMPPESNPYVTPAPTRQSSMKNTVDSVKDVLGKLGKKAADATKKGQDLAGNMWQHLKTGPSFTDAAVSRIAQGTKVLAEGGYEKVFKQNFEIATHEQLLKSYACYLSTSAGPVMGTIYLSTEKIGFCSDNPLSYTVGDKTEWSYYKVVIPRHHLKAANPSTSRVKQGEKYIQVISIDNHEFWFMGFVHYDSAVKNLQEAVPGSSTM